MLLSLIWLAIFFKGFNVESLRMKHLARLCLSALATTVSHCSPHSSSSTPSPSQQGNNYKPTPKPDHYKAFCSGQVFGLNRIGMDFVGVRFE